MNLIIRKAIAKYQFNQNVAKLRDEVTDKDIEAYIKTINECPSLQNLK